MDIHAIYARALRGIREDGKLYLVALSSLTVAFLCLATALLGVANLNSLASRWGQTHRISVYLREGAADSEVSKLRDVLASQESVQRAEYVSAELARAQFLRDSTALAELRELPKSAFPASLELYLKPEVDDGAIEQLARKVALQRTVVEDVDTYGSWFQRIGALVGAGRAAATGFGLLVLVCVMAVVANTIRLAIASRREEIEVLKMCGATDSFVRAPFVFEGALQGLLAALLSLFVLLLAFVALRTEIDPTLTSLAGMQLVFLTPAMIFGLLFGGALVGALGSALSVRRYIAV